MKKRIIGCILVLLSCCVVLGLSPRLEYGDIKRAAAMIEPVTRNDFDIVSQFTIYGGVLNLYDHAADQTLHLMHEPDGDNTHLWIELRTKKGNKVEKQILHEFWMNDDFEGYSVHCNAVAISAIMTEQVSIVKGMSKGEDVSLGVLPARLYAACPYFDTLFEDLSSILVHSAYEKGALFDLLPDRWQVAVNGFTIVPVVVVRFVEFIPAVVSSATGVFRAFLYLIGM